MSSMNKPIKIIVALIELFLGIPVVGGAFIIANGWIPLGIMFVVHIVALIIAINNKKAKAGHILGIVGNALGAIPVIGWFMHVVCGIVLIIEGLKDK